MGELILRYYLKVFSITLVTIFFLSILYFYYILNTKMTLNKNQFNIKKNESFDKILETNFDNISNLQINVSKIYYRINKTIFKNFVHYGDFYIKDNISILLPEPTLSAKNCSIFSQTSATSIMSIARGFFTFFPHLTFSGETL